MNTKPLYLMFSGYLILIAFLLGLLVLGGCGGGSDEEEVNPDKSTQPVECTVCKK